MKKIVFKQTLICLASLTFISCNGTNVTPSSPTSDNNSTIVREDDEVWVEQLEITKKPNKLTYIPNEEAFDSTGMIVKAKWSDGYIEENVSSTKYYVEPSGILPFGTTFVTVHYGDAFAKLDISTMGEYELCVIQMPVKTDYTVGEYFDPTGLILGYKINNVSKEFADFKIEDISFTKKALTKADTSVTVTYNEHSIDIPIKCFAKTMKIELEDRNYVEMIECKPKNQVKQMDDGTFRYGTSETIYKTYDDAYEKHTESAKCQMENASNKDFLSEVNSGESSFIVKFTPEFAKANLRIRGASNAVGMYDKKSKPTQSLDMDLTKIMNVEVNGEKIIIDSSAIFEGIVSSTPSHYVWTNWHTAFLTNIELNVNEENTIKFTFTTSKDYIHPWGSALGQYDYLLLEEI